MESQFVKACLDTHAVIWALAGDTRLGSKALELISTAEKSDLVISNIVLLEVSYLVSKGRIVDDEGLPALLAKITGSFRVVPISPEIAEIAVALDLPQSDPFDRVIAATAKLHGIPLLTRDRALSKSDALEILW